MSPIRHIDLNRPVVNKSDLNRNVHKHSSMSWHVGEATYQLNRNVHKHSSASWDVGEATYHDKQKHSQYRKSQNNVRFTDM